MRQLYFIIVLLLTGATSLFHVEKAHAEKRIALVIGNSIYQNTRALANPFNDAEDLAGELRRLGFSVDFEHELTKHGMEAAIARFAREAQGAEAALFYYAGHGMQYRGENYLMPTDAKLEDEFSLNFELTRLDDVVFGLERSNGVKILILDACRDNPLLDRLLRTTKTATRDLAPTRGLAKIATARGMVVVYSTQANQVALDGKGRNSPFAQALIKYLDEPKLEIGTLFRKVAFDVNTLSSGRQLPEYSVSLIGDFYLNMRDTDLEAWTKLQESKNVSELQSFIAQYPTSPLTTDARQKLDQIKEEEQARIAREEAERQRIEKEKLAKLEAERLEKIRLAQEQAERERKAQTYVSEERQNETAKTTQDRLIKSTALAPTSQTPCPDGSVVDETGKCQASSAHVGEPGIVRPEPKPTQNEEPSKENSRFNGQWAITWKGLTHCSTQNGDYEISIKDGIVFGNRKNGHISQAGSAQWDSSNRKGDRVNYTGTFGQSSGSGRFRNEKGCQGTFTAKRTASAQESRPKISSRTRASRAIQRPVENSPSGRCFTFGGKRYCE